MLLNYYTFYNVSIIIVIIMYNTLNVTRNSLQKFHGSFIEFMYIKYGTENCLVIGIIPDQ